MGSIVVGAEKYKLKAHDSKLNAAPLCLGNVSKHFQPIIWKRLGYMDMSMVHQSLMIVPMLLIFWIFINALLLRIMGNNVMTYL